MIKKQRKKLVYSILLFVLSGFLLYQITLGWFTSIRENNIEGLTLSNQANNLSLYQGIDADNNGVPDMDGQGAIQYSIISGDNIIINNVYPLYTVAYKAYYDVTASGGYCNLSFSGLTPPDTETPEVDMARAMKIKYTDPATGQVVDRPLYDMMDGNRNVSVLSSYHLAGNQTFSFEFLIYMDGNAGNEYKNKTFSIDRIVLSVNQE